MTDIEIREDDLTGRRIRALLREHLDNMHAITPPASVHALDLDGLRAPGITFWSAWGGEDLLGCGALKEMDSTSGEVKSMRTVESQRRLGVGSRLIEHIIGQAAGRGYTCLFLETGAFPAFEPARALYRRYGFTSCGPFGDYRDDPNSVYMSLALRGPAEPAAGVDGAD
jgi:putative acetyltransferase